MCPTQCFAHATTLRNVALTLGRIRKASSAQRKKNTDCGDRTHDHEIKSLALYRTELSRLTGFCVYRTNVNSRIAKRWHHRAAGFVRQRLPPWQAGHRVWLPPLAPLFLFYTMVACRLKPWRKWKCRQTQQQWAVHCLLVQHNRRARVPQHLQNSRHGTWHHTCGVESSIHLVSTTLGRTQ